MPEYVSKVVYGNTTLINLTDDTAVESTVLNGYTFHKANGEPVSGSCTFDADTSDANATSDDILYGKTAYKNGSKLTGTMANIGQQTSTLSSRDSAVAIQVGFHDGSGSVGLSSADKSNLIADNIREGVTILGIQGSMTGSEDVKATTVSTTPYTTAKTYYPSEVGDYNYFSSVTVNAIAYSTASNTGGGITVTIGTVAPT